MAGTREKVEALEARVALLEASNKVNSAIIDAVIVKVTKFAGIVDRIMTKVGYPCTNTMHESSVSSMETLLTLYSTSDSESSSETGSDSSESTAQKSEETSERQDSPRQLLSGLLSRGETSPSEPTETDKESTDDTSPSSSTARLGLGSTSTHTSWPTGMLKSLEGGSA
jgi:hypothetical protein